MNMQPEYVSAYTEGYVRINPDLLTTPTVIYEKGDVAPIQSKRADKASAYVTSSIVTVGEHLDIVL